MYKTLIVIAVVLVVAVAAYFCGKNGLLSPFSKNIPTTTLVVVATTEPTATATVMATPVKDEDKVIIDAVRAGLIAEHGQDAGKMTITISKVEGNFAKGMANDTGGGGIWFAAKVGSSWKLVWDGNGIIQCTDLKDYPTFPSTLIPSCWDTATNKIVNR